MGISDFTVQKLPAAESVSRNTFNSIITPLSHSMVMYIRKAAMLCGGRGLHAKTPPAQSRLALCAGGRWIACGRAGAACAVRTRGGRSAVFLFNAEYGTEDPAEESGAFDHDDLHRATRLSDGFAFVPFYPKAGQKVPIRPPKSRSPVKNPFGRILRSPAGRTRC